MGWGIKPKEEQFYLLFEESARVVQTGSKKLYETLTSNNKDIEKALREITEIEHKGDDVLQAIMDKLNQTFITPMDREDIYTIAQELDEVIDYIHGAIEKMLLYKTGEVTQDIIELSRILLKACDELVKTFEMLIAMKTNFTPLLQSCHFVKELETEGDYIYRKAMANLFSGGYDPLYVIKWKEVYKQLEDALDHCETIAKVVRGVVLKYS